MSTILPYSCIDSVIERRSSSEVSQTLQRDARNGITELSQRRHIYSAMRPSCWALTHILVIIVQLHIIANFLVFATELESSLWGPWAPQVWGPFIKLSLILGSDVSNNAATRICC